RESVLPSISSSIFFFLMILCPPRPTLFPYTTLFRSREPGAGIDWRRARPVAGAVDGGRTAGAGAARSGEQCGCRDGPADRGVRRSEEHTSERQSRRDLVCRLLLEKKKTLTCEVRIHD